MKKEVILFDINETVLNLESLKPKFEVIFGSPDSLSLWFSKLLHASTVCIATGVRSTFSELANTTLKALAEYYGCKLSEEKRDELLLSFASLPAHKDIKGSLSRLRSSGFKIVAFSNSSIELISNQMKNSGLLNFFDQIISVEETGSFKPNKDVYAFVASVLNEPVDNLRLIATHDWDTHGALSVGLQAAYINRSGIEYNPLYIKPKIIMDTMDGIVDKIIEENMQK